MNFEVLLKHYIATLAFHRYCGAVRQNLAFPFFVDISFPFSVFNSVFKNLTFLS
jgi:hypothetical protein